MLDIHSTSIQTKAPCFLLSICFAVAVAATISTRRVEAIIRKAANYVLPSTTVSANSKLNGKIVFSSDRQGNGNLTLWTMNSDGSNPTQLTALPAGSSYVYDEQPKWSPDGSKIAFRSFGRGTYAGNSIYVMNADGSDLRQIVIDLSGIKEAIEIGSFAWSPDGARFLFDAGAYITLGFTKTTANIFVVSMDDKNVVRLTNDSEVMNGSATWSPDGQLIAFTSSRSNSIEVMKADGSNRHAIAKGGAPSWSPDGSKILFAGPSQYGTCPSYVCQQLYTVSPDGSGLTQLTHYAASYGVYSGPRYSPDGAKIVFERGIYSPYYNITEIFVMEADGNNQINISNRKLDSTVFEDQPDWQPVSAPASDPPPSVLGFSDLLYLAPCFDTEITLTRNGNSSQAVSCAYQIQSGSVTTAPVFLSFGPGETSKKVRVSGTCDISWPNKITLINNGGNATFVNGIKTATIVFGGGNPIDNSAFFVRQHYRDFLGREPDPWGWDFWNGRIEPSCAGDPKRATCVANRTDTSAAFFFSIEFQETGFLVHRTYKAAYGNLPGAPVPIKLNEFLPDTREIGRSVVVNEGSWQQRLEANKQAFFSEFVQRSRFALAYPTFMTPVQFVDALFANAGVTPSVSERESAIGEFSGATGSADNAARARALRRVAENATLQQQEFNRAFVLMQYFGYLRRDPNSGLDANFDGYNFWLNKLNQFNGDYSRAEMVKAFISSGEYRQRFGP